MRMAEEEGSEDIGGAALGFGPRPVLLATGGQVRRCGEGAPQSAEAVRGAHGCSERHPQGRRLPALPGLAPGSLAPTQGDHGRQGLDRMG